MADVFFLDWSAGPGNIFLAFFQRRTIGMQAGNELSFLPQLPENFFPHAGHDMHIADNVGTVRDLDADFGNR